MLALLKDVGLLILLKCADGGLLVLLKPVNVVGPVLLKTGEVVMFDSSGAALAFRRCGLCYVEL